MFELDLQWCVTTNSRVPEPKVPVSNITDVSKLFTELEKQDNLGIERLEILKTMATEMEKPDLLQQVEEFDKKRKQEENADRKRRNRQGEESTVFISINYRSVRN